MIKNVSKWVHRCLGWILMGCVALGALGGYVLHKKKGYGTLELRVTWRDKAYAVDRMARGDYELTIRGKRIAWTAGESVRLRPGSADAELRVRGFRACSASAGIIKDTAVVAEFRLEAEPRTITVNNVKSNGVVNGKACGGTWVLQGAEVGRSYAVEVAAPGYRTNFLDLVIEKPGEDLITNLAWVPLMGFMQVSVAPVLADLNITLDGGAMDGISGGLVEVGGRFLSVSNADYYPYGQRVEVVHGVSNLFKVNLRPKPALLTVEVVPAVQYQLQDSAGRVVELSNGVARLPPGTNRLTIIAKGYTSHQQDFVMEPNRSYPWKIQIEKEGLQSFKRAEARFEALTNANSSVLERDGGRDWARIRTTRFDDEDLVRGAEQYSNAATELAVLLGSIKTVEKLKGQFQLLTTNTSNQGVLDKFGGADWHRIRGTVFDSEDVALSAQQYKEACESLTEVLKTMPERGRVWTNEIRSSNAIDYWILMNDLQRATNELAKYTSQFGAGTDFDRWFGGGGGKIKTWQDDIQHKERWMPDKPGEKKKR